MEIKYKKNKDSWGIEALYNGQRLNFSGPSDTPQKKFQKLFGYFFKSNQNNSSDNSSGVDIYNLFSPSAKVAWDDALENAKKRNGEVSVEDIFLALLKQNTTQNLMARLRVSGKDAETFLKNYLKLQPASSMETVKKVPFEAFALAVKLGHHKVSCLMLLGALLTSTPQNNILQAIFSNIGLTIENLEIFAAWIYRLDYSFPKSSKEAKLLYCCRQSQALEEHFGYFFELPAIEEAVKLSSKMTLKDLEHKKALQFLVKAVHLAKTKKTKLISQSLILQASGLM